MTAAHLKRPFAPCQGDVGHVAPGRVHCALLHAFQNPVLVPATPSRPAEERMVPRFGHDRQHDAAEVRPCCAGAHAVAGMGQPDGYRTRCGPGTAPHDGDYKRGAQAQVFPSATQKGWRPLKERAKQPL